MSEKKTKLYLELQMEELKATYGVTEEEKKITPQSNTKNAEIAKMYEDAAEYEADLKGFEEELEIVNANKLADIATALRKKFPDEERDYEREIQAILDAGWLNYVEVDQTHPKEQLEILKDANISNIVEKLSAAYPNNEAAFEADVRKLLVKRWGNLIAIKKEHIKQELAEIKTTGLKPKYVKRVYEQFHGIVK
jgi:hypothetical protein